MEGVARVFYKIIKLPKGSSFIPTDIISEIEMEKEASMILYGSNDEAEYLLPMCELDTKKSGVYKNRPAKIMEVIKQKNPAEILSKRISEYREKIVQYLGEEKLDELEALAEYIRKIDVVTKEEKDKNGNSKTVQELGKETWDEQKDSSSKKTIENGIKQQKEILRDKGTQQLNH